MVACALRVTGKTLQPVSLRLAQFGKRRLAVALMAVQEIVTSATRQPHQPMFEGRFRSKAAELLECLEPHLLHDVFDFALPAGIAARRNKNARGIFLD